MFASKLLRLTRRPVCSCSHVNTIKKICVCGCVCVCVVWYLCVGVCVWYLCVGVWAYADMSVIVCACERTLCVCDCVCQASITREYQQRWHRDPWSLRPSQLCVSQ